MKLGEVVNHPQVKLLRKEVYNPIFIKEVNKIIAKATLFKQYRATYNNLGSIFSEEMLLYDFCRSGKNQSLLFLRDVTYLAERSFIELFVSGYLICIKNNSYAIYSVKFNNSIYSSYGYHNSNFYKGTNIYKSSGVQSLNTDKSFNDYRDLLAEDFRLKCNSNGFSLLRSSVQIRNNFSIKID